MQNLISKIEFAGRKQLSDRLKKIVVPTCAYYDPIITLKFPYSKSNSNTRFINLSNKRDTEIEVWADDVGFIYEINILVYNKIKEWDSSEINKLEEVIPYFDYSQESIKNKSINFNCSQLELFLSKTDDLLINLYHNKLEDNIWLGYNDMYFGINQDMQLTSIVFKSSGLKDTLITKRQYFSGSSL